MVPFESGEFDENGIFGENCKNRRALGMSQREMANVVPFESDGLMKMAYLVNLRQRVSKNFNDMAKGQCLSKFQRLSKFGKNSKWKIRQFE